MATTSWLPILKSPSRHDAFGEGRGKGNNRSRLLAGFFTFCLGRFEMRNNQEQFNGDGKGCVHHWLIDAGNLGVCKKCGVSKQFCNSWCAIQRSWHAGASNVRHVDTGTKN
jgi:hypothetical protein